MKGKVAGLNKRHLFDNWPITIVGLALLFAPVYLSDFRLSLLGKYLTFAILALGLDLIWGYSGILSLGQGLFFGLGGYAFAMYLKLETSPGVPDFMSWSGLSALPWFWKPFGNVWFAVTMVIAIPVLLATILGFLTFRNRIKGVYFSILTQALTLIFAILFVGQQPYTGGTNGITNLKTIFGYSLAEPSVQRVLYLVTVACLGLAYFFCRWLVGGRFGRILMAIRDGENRLRFSGYNPVPYKIFVFAVAAGLAGLAGALFVPQVGIISPAMMGIVPSIEMAVWVAIGGRGTLVGAIIGAVLVNAAKSGLSESYPDIWLFFLGALFISVVLLFPDGIVGLYGKAKQRLRKTGEALSDVREMGGRSLSR
ncbi:MAG: urea ABC transporter permease subunit UrtC [Candidatus Aquicultorales bacterium]